MRCMLFVVVTALLVNLNFWKFVDAKTTIYNNFALDTGSCYKYITSVSYKACMDIFESGEYNVNVMVYTRRYLLCNLYCVSGVLELNKTPGSILVHSPFADKTVKNLALGKPSSQSSTYHSNRRGYASPSLAVDGFWISKMLQPGTWMCAHTEVEDSQDHWWMVDLEHIYSVSKIVILNRNICCWERLRNLTLTVGVTVDSMPLCNVYEGPGGPGENVTITCRNPMLGQFVRISKPATEPLQLCEVAVYS